MLCPTGWHIPTDNEWTVLIDYLGGRNVAGGKLKESCTSHWQGPNLGASNETGFTAVPGGYRYWDGAFDLLGYYGYMWSSRESDSDRIWSYEMSYDNSGVNMIENNPQDGLSIRCIRD